MKENICLECKVKNVSLVFYFKYLLNYEKDIWKTRRLKKKYFSIQVFKYVTCLFHEYKEDDQFLFIYKIIYVNKFRITNFNAKII